MVSQFPIVVLVGFLLATLGALLGKLFYRWYNRGFRNLAKLAKGISPRNVKIRGQLDFRDAPAPAHMDPGQLKELMAAVVKQNTPSFIGTLLQNFFWFMLGTGASLYGTELRALMSSWLGLLRLG